MYGQWVLYSCVNPSGSSKCVSPFMYESSFPVSHLWPQLNTFTEMSVIHRKMQNNFGQWIKVLRKREEERKAQKERNSGQEIGWHYFLKTEATSEDLERETYACSTTANNLLANVLFRNSGELPQQLIIHLQCRRYRGCGFNLWVRKMLWRRKWQATTVFFPGESHWQRSLAGYSPWGHKESDKTEQPSMWHSTQEAR